MLLAIIATVVLAGMAASMIAVSGAYEQESNGTTERLRAHYAAEAGLAEGIASARAGVMGGVASAYAPMAFGQDGFWNTVVDNGDETFTVTSFGNADDLVCGLEAVLVRQSEGPFASALFAGNTSGDPLYDLEFGGLGTQADDINGNIYSGGNVVVTGDADIDGLVRAQGTLSGVTGESGVGAPIPDIAGMNYASNNDVDVAQHFTSAAYSLHAGLGGSAWQLPATDPAHIFRKNPSDRVANTALTAKDDYFLEDPYESVNTSSSVTAANGSRITLSGLGGAPGPNGNDKLYFIDGNLWVHNRKVFTFTLFNSGSEGVRVTLVVKGNVYFSDNVFYHDDEKDGLAIIAIKDPAEVDSGNIYFGDPVFGTLEHMSSFMYAENNFYDNNLSATGSAQVSVLGNMTAGNQVLINRDFGTQHSRLTIDFDERLVEQEITLPGIPRNLGGAPTWIVASWRPIARPD